MSEEAADPQQPEIPSDHQEAHQVVNNNNNDEEAAQTQSNSTVTKKPSSLSLMAILTLVTKLVTMVCLIISMSVLASNHFKLGDNFYGLNFDEEVNFNDIYAYRYALSVTVIVLAYTLVELPLLIYKVVAPSGNALSNNSILAFLAFYADKVVLCLLATGVGAAFGYTVDAKRLVDTIDDDLSAGYEGDEFSPLRIKFDDFYNTAYVPSSFLLFAVLTSLASSVLSSLALVRNKNN